MTVVDLETPDGSEGGVFTYAFDPSWSVGDPSHGSSAPPEGVLSDVVATAGVIAGSVGVLGSAGEHDAAAEAQEVTEPPLLVAATVRPLESGPAPADGSAEKSDPETPSSEPPEGAEKESPEPLDQEPTTESQQPARPSGPIHFPEGAIRPRPPLILRGSSTPRPARPIHFPEAPGRTQRPQFADDLDDDTLIKELLASVSAPPNFPVSRRKGRCAPAPVKRRQASAIANTLTHSHTARDRMRRARAAVLVRSAGAGGGTGALW